MIYTYKVNNGTTLVIPVLSSEIEYLLKEHTAGFINLPITYIEALYDKNSMLLDFLHKQETTVTIGQLRNKYKECVKSISFRHNDGKRIRVIDFIEPIWNVSRDSYGKPCIKLTWSDVLMDILPKR